MVWLHSHLVIARLRCYSDQLSSLPARRRGLSATHPAYFFLNWLHGWPGVPLAAEGTLTYRMATTMTLAAIVTTQVGAVFACRTDRASVFRIGLFSNRLVLLGVAIELLILGLLIYLPFLQSLFNTAPIGVREWAFVFAWTPVIFLVDELRKALLRRRTKQPHIQNAELRKAMI